jgi:hypothetical protein
MRRRSRAVGWVLLGLLVTVVVQACGASNERSPSTNGMATGGTSGRGDMDATTVDAPTEGGAAGMARPDYDPLCGIARDGCVPDDRMACSDYRAGSGGQATGGSSGSGPGSGGRGGSGGSGGFSGETSGAGEAGASGESGAGGQGTGGESTDPGYGGQSTAGTAGSGNAGTGGSMASGSTGGSPPLPDGGAVTYSCQVHAALGEPESACLPAGNGGVDAPCLGGSDCRPGLACVGKVAGRCRPYCCDHDACRAEGTHCSVEPLVGVVVPAGEDSPSAPVCVPAIACNLAEDYPCTPGGVCSCPEGTACMVVGSDGSTSCVPPGEGTEGEACPCAWGYVCSSGANQCEKLCQTAAPADDCGTGRCQTSPALPLGWGICVGATLPDAG